MKKELIESIDYFENYNDIHSIILTGVKKVFCAGGDIKSLSTKIPLDASQSIQIGQNVILKILKCEKPIIVALNGIASGAGCSIVLAADAVIATKQSKLVFSFSNVGLIPDLGAMHLLSTAIGVHKSKELFFLGGVLSASEGFSEGILNHLVDEDKLIKETTQFAISLNNRSQNAIRKTKKLMNQYLYKDLPALFEDERKTQSELLDTTDVQKSINKFIEK